MLSRTFEVLQTLFDLLDLIRAQLIHPVVLLCDIFALPNQFGNQPLRKPWRKRLLQSLTLEPSFRSGEILSIIGSIADVWLLDMVWMNGCHKFRSRHLEMVVYGLNIDGKSAYLLQL